MSTQRPGEEGGPAVFPPLPPDLRAASGTPSPTLHSHCFRVSLASNSEVDLGWGVPQLALLGDGLLSPRPWDSPTQDSQHLLQPLVHTW